MRICKEMGKVVAVHLDFLMASSAAAPLAYL